MTTENMMATSVDSGDELAELKSKLADAVREYEVALMRNPMDEEEIRRAVDKCVNTRKQFNAANAKDQAPGGLPASACSAWWMYDNHTFQKVDITDPNWRGYVMACYDIDGLGSFFVRESPNGKMIFELHGRGREYREEFAASLYAWTPTNDKDQTSEGLSASAYSTRNG